MQEWCYLMHEAGYDLELCKLRGGKVITVTAWPKKRIEEEEHGPTRDDNV